MSDLVWLELLLYSNNAPLDSKHIKHNSIRHRLLFMITELLNYIID